MNVVLPGSIINKYEIVGYEITNDYRVERLRFVYHDFTVWEEYSDEPGGADICEQWMMYRQGDDGSEECYGRISEWTGIHSEVRNLYPTRVRALEEAATKLRRRITRLQEDTIKYGIRLRDVITDIAAL